ncbi:MAG: acyltransferase [Cystobacterineae bacterium]|nr:acyltransferase [Cystobacterineae bacterium]
MSSKPEKAVFHIPTLDGLRAVSFFIVFLAHAGLERWVPGGFGVTVFFFLSGFLITTLMRMEFEKTGSVSFKKFYLRRVLRIFPPFYVVLIFSTLLCALGVLAGTLEWKALLAQYFYYYNYWVAAFGYEGTTGGTGVYWSLAVEEHFYFLFPMLYVLMASKLRLSHRNQAMLLWALCALILAWRCYLVFVHHGADYAAWASLSAERQEWLSNKTYLTSDTRFDSMLFGCALALWKNPVMDKQRHFADSTWKFVFFPLGLLGLLAGFLIREPSFRESFRYSLQGLSLVPIFIVGIHFFQWWPFRWLNNKHVKFWGNLSYSLYLVHHVVIFAIYEHFPQLHGVLKGALALLVAWALSRAIYAWVEKPTTALRKRFAH